MFFPPLACLSLMVLGSGFFTTFTTLHLAHIGVSEFWIGGVQCAYYIGMILGSLRADHYIRGSGHVRVMTLALLIMALSNIALLPSNNLVFWLAMRFVGGACAGTMWVGIESWLLSESKSNKRGRALAIYVAVLYLFQSVSQLGLNLFGDQRYLVHGISALLVMSAIFPVHFGAHGAPSKSTAPVEKWWKIFKASPFGVILCFVSGLALSALYSFFPIYAEARSFSPSHAMTILILGGGLLQLPLGKLADRFGHWTVSWIVTLVTILPFLQLILVQKASWFYPILFICGGLSFALYPLGMALVCSAVPKKDLTKASGLVVFIYGVGSVVGPLVPPLFAPYSRDYVVWTVIGFVCLGLVAGLVAKMSFADQTKNP